MVRFASILILCYNIMIMFPFSQMPEELYISTFNAGFSLFFFLTKPDLALLALTQYQQ